MEQNGGITCAFCGVASRLHRGESDTVSKFITQLGVEVEKALSSQPLCEECYSEVEKAVEWSDQVGEVERDVRSLQRIILKMMRQLTSLQSNYLGEMKKLEKKISSSQGKKQRSNRHVGAMRDGVVNVVEELGIFMEPTQQQAVNVKNVEQASPSGNPNKTPTPVPTAPIVKVEPPPSAPPPPDVEMDIEHLIVLEDPLKHEPPPADPLADESFILPATHNKPKRPISRPSGRPSKRKGGHKRYGPCPICSRFFTTRTYLRTHMLTHSEDRPYQCPHCPQAFPQIQYLRNHERSHDAVPRFKCSHCPLAFRQRNGLHRHMKRLHTPKGLTEQERRNKIVNL